MRVRHWVLGALLSGSILTGMVQGCGTTPPIAALDSGIDTGHDAGTDSDLVDALAIVDASADGG